MEVTREVVAMEGLLPLLVLQPQCGWAEDLNIFIGHPHEKSISMQQVHELKSVKIWSGMQREPLQLPSTAQSTWGENVLGLQILRESVLVMQTTHGFGFVVLAVII